MVQNKTIKTVLVTGAAGFIGSHLCRRLIKDGYKVVGVDNLNLYYSPELKLSHIEDLFKSKSFNFVLGNIAKKPFLDELFKKYDIDGVIHLAARAGVRHSIEKPLWFEESNIAGTVNLLELAKQYEISNFIFASSSSVYGEREKEPFKEEEQTDWPVSPYSASKKSCELFCYTYSYLVGVPVTVLRFFNVYGPGMRPDLAMPLFTDGIENGKPIIQYGDGNMIRSYTYIDDITSGIIKALEKPTPYMVLNLGGEEVVALKELIKTLEEICGKEAIKNVLPKPKGDVAVTYADNNKAKKYLNWRSEVSFRQGAENFVKWYQEDVKKKKSKIFINGLTKRMMIFSVNYVPYMGGAEVAVKMVSDKIDHYFYDLICARLDRELPKKEEIGNVVVHRVGLGNKWDRYFYPILAFIKAISLKSKGKYDIIWGIMASYAGLSAMLVHLFSRGTKYVLSLHKGEGKKYFYKYTWFWWPVYRLIYARADAIQGTSSFHKDRARKYGYRGEVEVIPNGVINDILYQYSDEEVAKLREDLGFKEKDTVLTLEINSFDGDFDIQDATEALKELDDKYKLMVLCSAQEKELFADEAKKMGVESRVAFVICGVDFNLIKYLKISDMFLKIAREERLSTSLPEAMLCRVPIVGSEVPGIADFIVNGQNGLLYEAGNIEDLADKIRTVGENKELREKLVKNGFSSVTRQYDWETVAEKMKEIFEKV